MLPNLKIPKAFAVALRAAFAISASLAGFACNDGPTAPETVEPPTNVTVVMATPTSARVSWVASANADKVRSYNVFRNGTKVGEVTTTSFTDDGLVELTQYKYAVSANGLSGLVSPLSADSPTATITPPDVTPPRVTAVTPAAGATSVSTAATVTATFSEAVDSSTVNSSTFVVKTTGGASIAGTVAYTKATLVAEFRPAGGLPSAGAVTVAIAGVKDLAGNVLSPAFTSSFSVRDETAPTVTSSNPAAGATGISVSTAVSVTFSKAMDSTTITTSNVVLSVNGGSSVAATIAYNPASKTATLTPSAALQAGTAYTLVVKTGVKDISGNALASQFSTSFTTAAPVSPPPAPPPPPPPPPPVDTTRPTVVSSSPANGSSGVAISTQIAITFSEAMASASIGPSSFQVSAQGGGAVAGSITYDAVNLRATFTPASQLLNSTTYIVSATAGMTDLAGNALVPFTATFTTAAAVDVTPPSVVSTSPANGASGVSIDVAPTVTFSRAMTAATLNSSTVTLTPSGGSPTPASVSYNAGTNTATLTPSSQLASSTTYTLSVTTGAQGSNGVALSSTFSSTFTTAAPVDNTPPSVVSSSPTAGATNVAADVIVSVTFSEAMNASTVGAASMALKVNSTSATVAGSFAYNAATSTVTFAPSSPLAFSTGYTMIVSTGAKDLAGNALTAPVFISFTTMAQPDITPPSVVSSSPSNGATGVPINSTVSVMFSEDVNASTINASTFKLSNGADVAGSVSYNSSTHVATFTPSSPLATSQSYTATVTASVKDIAGNQMASDFVFSFTTAAPVSLNIAGEPNFSGTDAPQEIHLHIAFAQSGQNISLEPNCPADECFLAPLNQAGQDIVGPNTPGKVWVTISSLSGTLIGAQINFTINCDNGRTFSFSGMATATNSFTGTLSGATQPPVGLTMSR